MKKETKKIRARMDGIIGIICSENIYLRVYSSGRWEQRRCFNPTFKEGEIYVEDLMLNGTFYPVDGNRFFNGYGNEVVL